MAYTTIKKPSDYFNTVLYTGNGTDDRSITGVGFKPDWVWYKERSNVGDQTVHDVVRGAGERLFPNDTAAESLDANSLQAFETDGFQIGTNTDVNGNGETYVAWNWLADNTTGSSNTDGSITSTVSANTTSGFSIVSYTGTGANATVGHGLGSLPGMVIVKGRNTTSTNHWFVFHQNSQSSYSASGSAILLLNASNAVDTVGVGGVWNNTSPTSSVFNIGTENGVNESGKDFIAYCFAEKQGFSKFGSYTGNGNADGTFIYTGFKPAFVMFKITNTTGNWYLNDTARRSINVNSYTLFPNLSNAETTTGAYIDMLSNGFKLRDTGAAINGSGNNFIYMAFAEEPLVGDNPATAR